MGVYQKFRGDPEQKLFFLLNNFMGGINTEFSDDSSSDVDFERIINFDMDKLGTLNKRGGFGELNAISEIFNKLNVATELPNIKNRTPEQPNPENENDNVVYMKLLQNDNNCFRALSAFSGENAYRDYQKMYGFQQNRFKLLMITTTLEDGVETSSTAWLYQCYLPELEYEDGEPTDTETMTITCNKFTLPVIFNWDRNLMNIETVEFYDKIYFTGNNKCVVTFNRAANITSNTTFANAFTYSGVVPSGTTNSAYIPSGLEVRHIGFNVLAADPIHAIDTHSITTDSIQGIYVCTTDNKPLLNLPLGQKFLLNIIYTGTDNGFDIEMKDGDNAVSFDKTANSTLSRAGLKVYDVTFKDVPSGQVEIKITKTGATLEPYYDYYDVSQIDKEAKAVTQLNVGDYGICEMYNRAVYYKDDTIWFSELNNFDYIPNYNYVTLPIEPTDKITKICYFKKSYIIFTKQRIYKMINSFGTDSFAVSPVNTSLGCHAGNTVVPIDDTLYFSSPRGLYALKSSTFVEGFENVKELDLKVKKLTSDFTKYNEGLSSPAVRFNGVSERAYATRYKDKYLLFYNNYNDKGDYAAVNDLDVLAYQFDIMAYTTYRFKEKPTFLFMVDNAIETLATVAQKEEYTEEEILFNYNLNTQPTNGKVVDSSGNSNDADVRGTLSVNKGIGVDLDGTNDYVKVNSFSGEISDGMTLDLDLKLDTLTGSTLVDLQQTQQTSTTITGYIETNTSNNYKARLDYTITPNATTGNDTVAYQLTYYRYNNAQETGQLTYSLGSLIPSKTVNFNLTGVTSKTVDSGTFKISRDANFNYSATWNLSVTSSYVVTNTTTTRVYGADVNSTNQLVGSSLYWIKLGLSKFKASAGPNGCTITYQPYAYFNGPIHAGERYMYVKIDGTEYSNRFASLNTNKGYLYADERTVVLDYVGSKSISISLRLNIKATLYSSRTGTSSYYENVTSSSNINYTLPSITETTTTTTETKPFTINGSKAISLTRAIASNRELILRQVGNKDQLSFKISSENGEKTITTGEGIGLLQRHIWRVVLGKSTDKFVCTIYRDGAALISEDVATNLVINGTRDNCYLGTNASRQAYMDGKMYGLKIFNPAKTLLEYKFNEGSGTTIYDSSGARIPATLTNGPTWIIQTGMLFTGDGSSLQLPALDDTVYFSNGFKIEFQGVIGGNPNPVKILDFATSYNNDNSKNKKCSISVGVKGNELSFSTTGLDYITRTLMDDTTDLTQSHSFLINCVDNGSGYTISIVVDGVTKKTTNVGYGGISNIARLSNFIGKSNTTTDGSFKGILNNFKCTIYASASPIPIYRSALYEFDTTQTDFGRPIYVELETKGINMKYPQHLKKLKHIFVKVMGGYNYGELFFILYGDGYMVNNPEVYDYYIDENGTVVQEYSENKDLKINEKVRILGSLTLGDSKLGDGGYQTRKLIIPKKAKNFTILTYGESSDYISLESFGFVCKLGKVKEG